MQAILANWKTTSAGITAIVGAIVGLIYAPHPLTPEVITASVTAFLLGLGMIFARDGNKSSEQSGASTPQ